MNAEPRRNSEDGRASRFPERRRWQESGCIERKPRMSPRQVYCESPLIAGCEIEMERRQKGVEGHIGNVAVERFR